MTTKAAKALSELVKGSSKLSEVGKELKRTGGQSQFERLERAADEVPDLERQYTAEALLRAFGGRLGSPYRGVITINPADFERYARPLPDPIDTYSADNINDLRRIFRQSGKDTQGFDDVLFLDLGASKGEVPLIRGHEGRHRSRALAAEGQGKTLVEVLPRGDLMEYPKGHTRLSPEEWREAVNKLLEERGRLVGAEDMVVKKPLYEVLEKQRRFLEEQGDYQGVKDINEEIRRLGYEGRYEADPKSLVPFPEVFAKGGVVQRQEGSPQEGEISEGEIARRTLDFLRKQESSKFEGLSKQPRLDLPKVTKDVVRGVQYTPFDVLGAPVDIATMAMRPFGYNVEKPVGGSDYLIEQAAKVGLAQPQTGSVAEFAGRVLGGGLAPVVASKAGKIGEATEEFIKAELAKPPEGAVKFRGGVFPKEGTGRLDDYLQSIVANLSRSDQAADMTLGDIKAVEKFILEKGRKYLTTSYGTGSDPIREALYEGRLPVVGSDKRRFRNYLLQAARENDPEALEDLEKLYDTGLSISTKYLRGARDRQSILDEITGKMRQEGVPEDLMRPDNMFYGLTADEMGSKLSADYLQELSAVLKDPSLPSSDPTLLRAAQQGEPFFDLINRPDFDFLSPGNLANSILSLDPAKLKNMSFPEAVIQGTKNMRSTRDWQEVIRKVRDGKNVPKEVFEQGVKPVSKVEGGQWVQVITPKAVELEGAAMHHSVGGYAKKGSYGHGGVDALESGKAQVFSLRGPDLSSPRVTIEALKKDDGSLDITQIKGNYNGMPSPEDQKAVVDFLRGLPVATVRSERYTVDTKNTKLPDTTQVDWEDLWKNQ